MDVLDAVGHHFPRFRQRATAARLANFIDLDGWDDPRYVDDMSSEADLTGTPIAE